MKSNRVIVEIRSPPDVLVCFLLFIILWCLCTEMKDCTGTKLKLFSDLLWTFTWMCIMFSHNPCLCNIFFNILIFSYVSLKQGKEKWSGVEMEYTFQDLWKSFRSLAWGQDSTKLRRKNKGNLSLCSWSAVNKQVIDTCEDVCSPSWQSWANFARNTQTDVTTMLGGKGPRFSSLLSKASSESYNLH